MAIALPSDTADHGDWASGFDSAGSGPLLASTGGEPSEWRSRLFWRAQCCGWVAAAVLSTISVALGPFTIWHAVLLGSVRNIFGFSATTGMRYIYHFLRRRTRNVWIWALVAVPLSGLVSAVDGAAMLLAASIIGVNLVVDFLFQLVIASTFMRWVLYLLWSFLYFGINYGLDVQQEQLRAARKEAEMRTNELRLLRAQVNPHFLFNALTSIQAVAGDRERAEPLIRAFGDYLRFSLEGRRDMLPLGVELEALENYLRVEKVRFGSKLEYRINASPEARKAQAPIALVQPLLENAVKFGLKSGLWPVRIGISAVLEQGRLRVTVVNSGHWMEAGDSSSTGIGLGNLRRRLNLIYGRDAQLTVEAAGEEVRAAVAIPA